MTRAKSGSNAGPTYLFKAHTVERARTEAVFQIRALLNREAAQGSPLDLARHVAIHTQDGVPVGAVTFAEAYGPL